MAVEYVAVPDPDRPDQMTHWRRKGGILRAYPRGSQYGLGCLVRVFYSQRPWTEISG